MIQKLLNELGQHPVIESLELKVLAGMPFLYIQSSTPSHKVSRLISQTADTLIHQTPLHYESIYVRTYRNIHVYRFRFLYPLNKSFCCGNQCGEDCVLRKQDHA
ncbi:hypothetical protein [Ammoniphilus sp. YIM 78166]|uniref:hypothetical protein n=1 Tax=Ammoniphilus sp. YIM 78166 TaxID=1644106 RepID=UPI00107048E4|nr:hypothetical protein [Ammoniphilus sp. YIM 78166]